MESLGIEGKLLLGQIVNFLILLGILWAFLYKPVLKMLDERRGKVAQSLEDAKAIEEKLAATEARTQELLKKSQEEASRIISETQSLAQTQKKEMLEMAKNQSDKIIAAAQTEATNLKNNVVAEAKKDMASILSLALDKIIGSELTPEDKKRISDKAITEL